MRGQGRKGGASAPFVKDVRGREAEGERGMPGRRGQKDSPSTTAQRDRRIPQAPSENTGTATP